MNTTVDLTPVLQAGMGVIAALLTALGTKILITLEAKLKLQVSNTVQEQWNEALDNAIQYGVQVSMELIRQKGWDHPDVHNQILKNALPYIIGHVPDLLHMVGLTDNPQDLPNSNLIEDALRSRLPSSVHNASRSIATPPASFLSDTLTTGTSYKSDNLRPPTSGVTLQPVPPQ